MGILNYINIVRCHTTWLEEVFTLETIYKKVVKIEREVAQIKKKSY